MSYAEIIHYGEGVAVRVKHGTAGLRHSLFFTVAARDAYLAILSPRDRERAYPLVREWHPLILRDGIENGHVTVTSC